jgi:hypothetical protein
MRKALQTVLHLQRQYWTYSVHMPQGTVEWSFEGRNDKAAKQAQMVAESTGDDLRIAALQHRAAMLDEPIHEVKRELIAEPDRNERAGLVDRLSEDVAHQARIMQYLEERGHSARPAAEDRESAESDGDEDGSL